MGAGARPELVSAMLEPSFYPQRPARVELRETHISWVLLADGMAYKVKKPLVLPFLDFGTLARRREMCREEVRLNRRLAPAIYLRVVAIVSRNGAYALAPEEDPGALEYAVEMRRVEEDRTMASLISRGELQPGSLDRVAEVLASFHAEAEPAPPEMTGIEVLQETLEENAATLRRSGEPPIAGWRLDAATNFVRSHLDALREELTDRAARGLIRDVHGDLRAEHVVIPRRGGPYVYDCVEFNATLRQIDVAADLAFLVMDLFRLGTPALADRLVSGYRARGGDPGSDRLLAFFAAYRAWVRSKVALLRAAELAEGVPGRQEAVAEAERLFTLGELFAWRSRSPVLLVVCGVTGSGKSTLAEALSARSALPHLSSDIVRKRLAGLEPTERAGAQHYSPAFTDRTYRELGRAARNRLTEGRGAIVDATFHLEEERRAFRSGLGSVAAMTVFIECAAPRAVLTDRVRRRSLGTSVSDADETVLERQLAAWEALDEIPAERRVEVKTDSPLPDQLRAVEAFLDDRLASAHGA